MNTLVFEQDPRAIDLQITDAYLVVRVEEGRTLSIPLEWYPRLSNASVPERGNWQFFGGGYAIEWPDLGEHIGIEGLIVGRRSGESPLSLQKWLNDRH